MYNYFTSDVDIKNTETEGGGTNSTSIWGTYARGFCAGGIYIRVTFVKCICIS